MIFRGSKPYPVRQFKNANWESIRQSIGVAGPPFQKISAAIMLIKIG